MKQNEDSSQDYSKYVRTRLVVTEERPDRQSRGNYASYWLFKPHTTDGNTGSLHQYLLKFDTVAATYETEVVEECHNKNISRREALAALLEAEKTDIRQNRPLADTGQAPFSHLVKDGRYSKITYIPLEETLIKESILDVIEQVRTLGGMHAKKTKKMQPKFKNR